MFFKHLKTNVCSFNLKKACLSIGRPILRHLSIGRPKDLSQYRTSDLETKAILSIGRPICLSQYRTSVSETDVSQYRTQHIYENFDMLKQPNNTNNQIEF
jgi:hypothetical protein